MIPNLCVLHVLLHRLFNVYSIALQIQKLFNIEGSYIRKTRV